MNKKLQLHIYGRMIKRPKKSLPISQSGEQNINYKNYKYEIKMKEPSLFSIAINKD